MRLSIALFIAAGLALAAAVWCRGQNNGGRAIPPLQSGSSSLLLDSGPSAYAAFSIARKLRTAYAGSALRVRRSSDNTEQDIGFNSNVLDTSSLTTFVGANNGFVVTVYDQSGNARNITQATTGNQPQIVASGSVLVDGDGKPWLALDGTDDILTSAAITQALPITHFTVASVDTHVSGDLFVHGGATGVIGWRIITSTGQRVQLRNGASLDGDTYSTATQFLVSCHYASGNDSIQLNNASDIAGLGGDNSPSPGSLNIGHATVCPDGNVSEWVIYASAVTGGDLTAIQGNINAFYTLW